MFYPNHHFELTLPVYEVGPILTLLKPNILTLRGRFVRSFFEPVRYGHPPEAFPLRYGVLQEACKLGSQSLAPHRHDVADAHEQ